MNLLSIWTKPKFIFLLVCRIRDILNFKSARLKVNSLTFHKNVFLIENRFITDFFSEWGASASALARARQGPHLHSLKKFVMKQFSMKKTFLWKVKEFTLSRADLKFKMSRILQTSRKINFGFVQIGSRFNYNMKIFFVARNNYLDKLDSQVCITVLKNLILVFSAFPN